MNLSTIKHILTIVALVCTLSLSAQKKNVMVHPTTGQKINSGDLARIHNSIVEGLANLPTINILDESNDGAETDMHFKCNIDSVCVYAKKHSDGKTTYVTEINMRASVYDDGKDENDGWSIPLSVYNSMLLTSYSNKKESAQSALEWIPEKVERNFWEPFAVAGQLLGVEETKKDKAQTVSCAIGSAQGAAVKQEFGVYLPDPRILDKNGNLKENKPIGKVQITDMGDDVSVCKVKGGGDKIYAAFLEDPKQLTVKSKAPTKGFIKDKKYQAQYVAECIWMAEQILDSVKELVGAGVDMGKEVGSIF